MSESLKVLKEFKFWTFAIFLFGIAGLYFLFDQQFQDYYATFFHVANDPAAGGKAYSYLYASETAIEVICLPLVPFIVNLIGARKSLVLAAFLMGMRVLLIGLVADKVALTLFFLIRGFEIPLLLVAVFKFMEGVYDPRFSSTIYLIAFQFAQQFCSICFAGLVGHLIDAYGFQCAYIYLGIFGLVFMLWGLIMLPRLKQGRVNLHPMGGITPVAQ